MTTAEIVAASMAQVGPPMLVILTVPVKTGEDGICQVCEAPAAQFVVNDIRTCGADACMAEANDTDEDPSYRPIGDRFF